MSLINYITQIQFDIGAIACLPAECERIGITRPLIVTDRGVRAAGIVDTALNTFASDTAQLPIYDGTPPNPNEHAVREAVAMFKAYGCDGISAMGGGSAIDLAKGVAVCARHDGPLKCFAVIEGGLA
ncbi:MAG TPA: 4-hydroxybutyrate dehydrogenase, partial [Pseudomonas sp.]|nr:4-hydroxybutyrate dehydrogenase [Pseudomonas sp.]